MAKRFTGVYLRNGTNVFQWRIRVPKDLQHLYPDKVWADRRTLGTSTLAQANLQASQLYATWLAKFESQRKQFKPQAESLTPELIKFFSDTLLHEHLASDQLERESGMHPELQAENADENVEEAVRIQDAFRWGELDYALPALQYQAGKQGITVNQATPGFNEALRAMMHASLTAITARITRDHGRFVLTPPAPPKPKAPVKAYYLRDVFDLWKKADGLKCTKDTVRSREIALELYEEFTENPPIGEITRLQGNKFKAWLMDRKVSSKTTFDRLTYVKALFSYAVRELELLDRHPWDRITTEYDTETRRKPWTLPQISAFFAHPLYTSYTLPRLQKGAGADAGYWIPLLGLFSGARCAELCQLHVADILELDGVWVIDINENVAGKTVKTKASRRKVPIHSELIRLGFLEYVDATRKAGDVRLWPKLTLREGKPSHTFSKWFNVKQRMAITGMVIPDFHSLRHTVRTNMTTARVSEQHQDKITGHEVYGSTGGTVYANHVTTAQLKDAVEAIEYKGFSLPRSYAVVD